MNILHFGIIVLVVSTLTTAVQVYIENTISKEQNVSLVFNVSDNEISTTEVIKVPQRPFYLFAHMVNSIPEIKHFLSMGANAIEADVQIDSVTGEPTVVYHGPPDRCNRNSTLTANFEEYLLYLRRITTPGDELYEENLLLLYLDLKISSQHKKHVRRKFGNYLAEALLKHLYPQDQPPSTLKVIIAPPDHSDLSYVYSFISTFNQTGKISEYIGWDMGKFSSQAKVNIIFNKLGISNVWVADGDYHCERSLKPPRSHLKLMVNARNSPNSVAKKVLQWTVDINETVEETLAFHVDSIMTNRPDVVIQKLQSDKFREYYRMATIGDNPWEKVVDQCILWGSNVSTVCALEGPVISRMHEVIYDEIKSTISHMNDGTRLFHRFKSLLNLKGELNSKKILQQFQFD